MKRRIKIAYLMVFILLSITTLSYGMGKNYEGIRNYESIYHNATFQGIGNHWSKKSILKMGALSIIGRNGSNGYYPNQTIDKEEAVVYMIRLMGLEDEAQTVGEKLMSNNDTGNYHIFTPKDHWAQGYLKVAQSKGIVTKEEVKKIEQLSSEQLDEINDQVSDKMEDYSYDEDLNAYQQRNIEKGIRKNAIKSRTWKRGATREEVAVWVAKMLGLKPIYGTRQQMIYDLKDWKSLDTMSVPFIEAIMQKGIMRGDNGYFHPKTSVTKGEMAAILDQASEHLLRTRGYKILSGSIDRIQRYVTTVQDPITTSFVGVENTELVIHNDDDQFITITAQESSVNDFDKGFLVYKNGALTYPKDLRPDDYVKYFINEQNKVVYMEVE